MKAILSSKLKLFINEKGLNQSDAARMLGVSQSVVSRALNGNWTRESKQMSKLIKAVGVERNVDPTKSDVLMKALESVWDGTPETVKALADAILALGKYAEYKSMVI